MIRESHVDANLNRLSAAFGPRLIVRPPASAEDVAQLEQLVGPLPREFAIFLLTCNGLRIRASSNTQVPPWHLWNSREIAASILDPQGLGTSSDLLPFCGDSTATRDCLVTMHVLAEGAVVRWDPLTTDVELLCSGFGHYLDRWTGYMIERLAKSEDTCLAAKVPSFDATYIGAGDLRLATLYDQESLLKSLHQLDHVVASGDDFE